MDALLPRVVEFATAKNITLYPTQIKFLESIDTVYQRSVELDRFFPATLNFGMRSGNSTLFSFIQGVEPDVAIVNGSQNDVKQHRDYYASLTIRDLEAAVLRPVPQTFPLVIFDLDCPWGLNQHTGWWQSFTKLISRLEFLRQFTIIS